VVGVTTLADKSIGIAVKPWVKVPDYVAAGAEINQAIVEGFGRAGVEYPRAAREIRVIGSAQP
jgi:small conductance mechanosensitive channel